MKWADYVITAVRYAPDRSHIAELEVRVDNGESIGPPGEWARQQVISAIDGGHTFATAYLRNGSWQRGADVQVVTIGRDRFLRTDRNKVRADNLGELPELPPRAQGASRW
jgi:Protein of unknown function (DUF3892)